MVGVEAPLSDSSLSESEDSEVSVSESASDTGSGFGGSFRGGGDVVFVVGTVSATGERSSTASASRLTVSGSRAGSGGLVGAGVASPEARARLSEDRDSGMSVPRSGSGGAENRSENPPPDLTAGAGAAGGSTSGEGG